MKEKKTVLISFLGNINYDSRCLNLYHSLSNDFDVEFMGFDWTTPNFVSQKGKITIKKLHKGKISLIYYLAFGALLKVKLLFSKYDIYFAEDLYTLPLVTIFGKIKGGKIIYDSREIFGHLAGLNKKETVQGLIKSIEKFFIKKADIVTVTGEMDKEYLIKEYQLNSIIVVRNLPKYSKPTQSFDFRKECNIPSSKKILIYQGMIHHGRGIKLVFELLQKNDNYVFIILGEGAQKHYFENLAKEMGIKQKVIFFGKVSQSELLKYTKGGDVGLSLIENISLSYFYALPNKLFEYIMVEIPCVVSNLPQMDIIIKKYKVGLSIPQENAEELNNSLEYIFQNENVYKELVENCKKASSELNWDKEIENLLNVLR
jgi:glycosyltransferase involved in cell wall biosynthesis